MLRGERELDWIGNLHPRLTRALDLKQEVYVFELDVEYLAERSLPRATELSRFPSIRRDLALVLPEATPFQALRDGLVATLGEVLRECFLFDVYQGPGVEAGFRSLAIGLILQESYRTLTDEDADDCVRRGIAALERGLGARLRS